jgi:anti-anti-sigma regulatory factor
MDLLVVDYEVRPEAVVLQAKGEVDSSTAGDLTSQLDAALQQAGTQASRLLIIDLQAVTYFGSAGLNHGLVVRPIEVTNLDSVLELYPTLPDALQGRDTEQGQ